ncbi:Uncharacterized protein APZ42_004093 [Daphnia magna]|uniref:Secreted protein n=1 Tax=Daphnia magna TaxID=35525 RepID=A0A162F114_9CRUS|nr:Uncharacterized protein APZ42_004093 [Daphnia magna]
MCALLLAGILCCSYLPQAPEVPDWPHDAVAKIAGRALLRNVPTGTCSPLTPLLAARRTTASCCDPSPRAAADPRAVPASAVHVGPAAGGTTAAALCCRSVHSETALADSSRLDQVCTWPRLCC